MNWRQVTNSLFVSAAATASAVALGFVAALWAGGLKSRRCVTALSIAALLMPPFLVTSCWLHYFGLNGIARPWLPFNIYSLPGALLILSLLYWPIPMFAAMASWRRLEVEHFEADPALRGWPLLRWLLWPTARAPLGIGALIVFVLALNNFAVPTILQVPVLPAQLWVNYNTNLNASRALLVGLPLIVVPGVLLLFMARTPHFRRFFRSTRSVAPSLRASMGTTLFASAAVVTVLVLFLAVVLPGIQLLGSSATWNQLPIVLHSASSAIRGSALYASVIASVCVVGGLALCRFRITGLLWLLFFAPGVLIGVALIVVFNRPSLAFVYGTSAMVVIGCALRYMAATWNIAREAMRNVDADLIDAARLEGARGWALWRHVYAPRIWPQLAAGWYIIYLLCLWEVETLILLIPPGGETLAVRIFNLLHYGHNAQVDALCLVLIAIALVPLLTVPFLRRMTPLLLAGALISCSRAPDDSSALRSQFFSSIEVIGARGTALGQFNKPRSVAVDRDDNLYVADMTGRVQKFSPRGEYLLSWQMPRTDLGKPKGMTRDPDGNIVVLEPHYSRVNHFSPDGKLLDQWGKHGTNAGEFALPRSVAVNSKGILFVSEYGAAERIQFFSANEHRLLGAIGRAGGGAGEFNRAEGVAIDSHDRLMVADSCNHRIQVFDADGKHVMSFGKPGSGPGELNYPYDVCADRAGNIFVCEFGNSRIQVFGADGQSREIIGGPGVQRGRFNNPWSMALDSHGNLHVADANNHRVQKLLRRPTEKR